MVELISVTLTCCCGFVARNSLRGRAVRTHHKRRQQCSTGRIRKCHLLPNIRYRNHINRPGSMGRG